MVTDEELYQRVRRGDLPAFDSLYERYRLRLYRFVFSYLKNEQESEDVFHEAFMKVLKNSDLDFSKGTFQSWIFEVSRNLSLNRIRSSGRASNAFENPPESESISAETLLEGHETALRAKSAIQKLPQAQSEILKMKLLGLPEKEIASVLQIPLGTVKSRFHAIVEFLRQEVKE